MPTEKQTQNTISTASATASMQPLPSIIRKPTADQTNEAVAAIIKNNHLTVTQRNIASPSVGSAKQPPIAGVNNSITLSPIPNKLSGNSSMTITPQGKVISPQQGRTLSPMSKPNTSSPVPVAISKINQTVAKSPTNATMSKPNVLSSRNSNTSKTLNSVPKPSNATTLNASNPRILNNNQSGSPKVSVARPQIKPIITSGKMSSTASAAAAASIANKPGLQIKQVKSLAVPKIVSRGNTTITSTVDARKRLNNDPIASNHAKKPKPLQSSVTASVCCISIKK